MEKTQKIEIKTDETTTAAVTVFEDRAEVTRLVSLSPSGAGTYELCVQGLPDKADEDSIRCKAAATYKGLTIQEVSFEVHVTTVEAAAAGSEAELRAKIKELTAARSAAAAEQARSAERKAMLSTYVKGMLAPLTSAGGVAPPSAGSSLAKVEELLDFQETQAAKADAADLATAERLSGLDAELEAARSALAQLSAPARMLPKKTTKSRDVTILLSAWRVRRRRRRASSCCSPTWCAAPRGSRRTTSASSRPSSRCSSPTSASSQTRAVRTGRTAASRSPPPSRRVVGCRRRRRRARRASSLRRRRTASAAPARRRRGDAPLQRGSGRRRRDGRRRRVPMQAMMSNACLERNLSFSASEVIDGLNMSSDDEDEARGGGIATTAVTSGGALGTATFAIERLATIEADNKPHKVTVALLDFDPKLLYFVTPELSTEVYLQVKARNTSSFPILASEAVNVYMDGSYITKTQLKDVSPPEEFTTFLGVDPALKVEHQQIQTELKQSGWTSKQSTSTAAYRTVVVNTKPVATNVTLVQLLPKSTDEKIKVELIAPTKDRVTEAGAGRDAEAQAAPAAKGSKGEAILQNKVTNNLVFHLHLEPSEKREIPFSVQRELAA